MYDDAVVSFTNVLEMINPIIRSTPAQRVFSDNIPAAPPTSSPYHNHSQSQRHNLYPHFPQHQQPQQLPPQQQEQEEPKGFVHTSIVDSNSCTSHSLGDVDTENGQHFVFRDPIDIPYDVVPTMEEPSDKLINKFVVVIMYNLALSVHLSAIQGHFDVISLKRARKLYELAFQMHLEESCDVTLLYSLALMNNLGLIYHSLGEEERSRTCFENMLATMMYLLESDEAKSIKQWDGLLSNVMDRIFKEQVIAAPAA